MQLRMLSLSMIRITSHASGFDATAYLRLKLIVKSLPPFEVHSDADGSSPKIL